MASLEWTAWHLLSYPGGRATPPKHHAFNPRPHGAEVPGSASEALLNVLQARYPGWLTNRQLVVLVRARGGLWRENSLRWALVYLRQRELIEASGDEMRNARYLRYRALPHRPVRPAGR
jgi:hypothetical protein